jgi:hypothetical protein
MPDAPADRAALLVLMSRHSGAARMLAAIEAAGCAVVPREPTKEMLAWSMCGWKDMLAASPYRR